ncbi:hypothetical protein R1sor_007240 [Riccia sorocarpa]|uniref:MADS-box domain-containing protein n=1 Tax=Riccia sorocarpa TaxID=122646 RepID=A0ABD3HW74_9MARC
MGRVKLNITKIDDVPRRHVTYAKGNSGLLKKAYELSVLCAADVGVIIFTPSGKPTVFCSTGGIEQLITRFANTPPYDRPKRSPEQLEKFHRAVRQLDNHREQLGVLRTQPAFGDGEVMKLRDILDKAIVERNFWEEKAKLFRGEQSPQSMDSMPQLVAVEVELKQGLGKLMQRMHEQATYSQLTNERNREISGRPQNMVESHRVVPVQQIMGILHPNEEFNSLRMDQQFTTNGPSINDIGGSPRQVTCNWSHRRSSVNGHHKLDLIARYTCETPQQVSHVSHDVVDPIPMSTTSTTSYASYDLTRVPATSDLQLESSEIFGEWVSQAGAMPLFATNGNQFDLQRLHPHNF